MRIALFGCLVHFRTARIAKSDSSRHLIEGLSGRIISRPSNDLELAVILYDDQMRMSAGYDQADKRRLQIRVFNIVCRDMTFNMMHAHKWFFRRKGNGFRLSHTN